MTLIPVDKEFLMELVDCKLSFLTSETEKILIQWNYQIPLKFLKDAADGTIEEAEDDAITLRHLIDQREELVKLKASWNSVQ